MGNYNVGLKFLAGISILTENDIDNMTHERAYDIIHKVGTEVMKQESRDAEFINILNPNEKLGRLVIKAFHPNRYDDWKNMDRVTEEIDSEYYNHVYKPFREKFNFV